MPPVPLLAVSGVAAVRRPLVASQVLSLLARDAVDLFASPLASRIFEDQRLGPEVVKLAFRWPGPGGVA